MTMRCNLAYALNSSLILCLVGCGSSTKAPTGASSNPWQGHTYLLNVPDTHWTQPKNVGKDIGPFVPKFLLGVNGSTGTTLDVLLGTSDASGVQDLCNPTTSLPSTAQYPDSQLGPADAMLFIRDATHGKSVLATARELTIKNALPGTDTTLSPGEFSATVDLRELYSLFYLLTDPTADSVCTALAQAGTPCAACPQDGAAYCLTLKAIQLAATALTDVTVQGVDSADLGASCEDGGA